MHLNATEVRKVEQFLRQLGKLNGEQQAEVLDHLCCDIEQTMEQGMSFAKAFAQ